MFLVVFHLVPLLLLAVADVQLHQANATEKQLGGGVDCGAVLRGAEFRLVSPGYPLPAPRGLTCFYVIEAAHPSICFIELTFLTFDLGDCGVSGDTLEVAGQVLCGGRTVGTRSFRFNPPRSLIVYRSGKATGGSGFEILVRQQQCPVPAPTAQPDCSATYTAQQFYIQSPTRRPTGRVCEYTIIASNRPSALCQAELLFMNFDLEATAGCTGERLEIGDQDVLCGILTGTKIYRFIGLLRLRYISTKESIGSGFKILVVQKGCRQLALSNNGGGLPPTVPVPTPPPNLGPNFPHLPPIHPPVNPNIPQWSPLCCGIAYGSRHFYLTSPGFPYYNGNADKECVYRILPSGPDICRVRIIFRFFWLGKEDSYIGCLNNGYLQLDDGQRICGCKTGAVLILPYFQGQEKVLRYRGYSGGGFLLELFQESCTDLGWFETAPVRAPQVEEVYPFSAARERHGFNVSLKNATESRIYETADMNNSNIPNINLLSSDFSTAFESKGQEISPESLNITLNRQHLEMKVPHTANSHRFSEGGEQHGNLSAIKNALNKNCKVSWKISVSEDSNKQVLPCSNKSNEPADLFMLKNESLTMFMAPTGQLMSKQDSAGASLSSSEHDLCNSGNTMSVNVNLTNKIQGCRYLHTVDYLQNKESRRNRRGVYIASSKGNCYSWNNMVQEARRFLWINGLPRTLCPGSRRCQVLAEAAGWFKIPGYPPAYPNNVHLCFG